MQDAAADRPAHGGGAADPAPDRSDGAHRTQRGPRGLEPARVRAPTRPTSSRRSNALVRPMSDLGLYLAGAADWRSYERTRASIGDNDAFRRDILRLLDRSGPLTSRDIPDTCVVPWASSGWTNRRNVTQMLEFLMMRGEVAIAGRVGRERVWDLAERVYPADVVVPSVSEAERIKNERRLASLGIARAKTTAVPVEPICVGDAGEPAVVEGVKGEWRVDRPCSARLRGTHGAAVA